MEKLIKWLLKNGALYRSKASTHTGYYHYQDNDFSISFYDVDKRVYVFIIGNPPGTGRFVYTDDYDRIKNIYKSIFNFN